MGLFPLLTNVLYSFVGFVRDPILEDIISIKVLIRHHFLYHFFQ